MDHNRQILFLSHGGGPMPLLGDPGHKEMVECLRSIATTLRRPSAILVISAHWEERIAMITAAQKPALIYDYYGFPEESYRITYPSPGQPELAKNLQETLNSFGIPSGLEQERGFDHGMFVPLKIMFPEADIPTIQLSLLNHLDPVEHLKMGAALQTLEHEDLLVIGSGFSFHNLKAFFAPETDEKRKLNESFEAWLIDTCSNPHMSEETRYNRLSQWTNAPAARFCHPREEHLLPLLVCYGVAQAPCTAYYEPTIMNKKSSMFLWS